MLVLNCTVLIENSHRDKLIIASKDILEEYYKNYNPKVFLVLEEIQEGISNVSFQFFLQKNQTHSDFEANEFQDFINGLSSKIGSQVQCFLTPLALV
jgi:hypothetical protein